MVDIGVTVQSLDANDFESFLERFGRFGDGVIREVHLIWRPTARCTLLINALTDEGEWVEVTLEIAEVERFAWASDWPHGCIMCDELLLRKFDDVYYVGVGEENELTYQCSEDFRQTLMFVAGRQLSFAVGRGPAEHHG